MRLDVRVSEKGWGKERKLEVQGGWSSKNNVSRVLVPFTFGRVWVSRSPAHEARSGVAVLPEVRYHVDIVRK